MRRTAPYVSEAHCVLPNTHSNLDDVIIAGADPGQENTGVMQEMTQVATQEEPEREERTQLWNTHKDRLPIFTGAHHFEKGDLRVKVGQASVHITAAEANTTVLVKLHQRAISCHFLAVKKWVKDKPSSEVLSLVEDEHSPRQVEFLPLN